MSTATYRILEAVAIPMRDGCITRADVWLPDGAGPRPVLLQRTPYNRADAFGTQYISAMDFKAALARGYAVVVADTRGRYGSDGNFRPFGHEEADGEDTIAWLRSQPFCDGRVVMFGASYVGATQVLAAAASSEGLMAISPHLTTARHGETWAYRGGAVELGFLLLWIIEALAPPDLDRRLPHMSPADAARARETLAAFRRNPGAAFSRLPVLDEALLLIAPYAMEWFDSDRALRAADHREHLDALLTADLPIFVSAGYNDLFLEGGIELFETMKSRWPAGRAVRDRLLIGPWSHGNPSDWQGDFWHGYAASTAGLASTQLDFFDAALEGRTPDMPPVRYFRTGSNTWHDAENWPLPGSTVQAFFASAAELTPERPERSTARSYVSDTLDPVPTTGGATFLPGLLLGRNSGPRDQAAIENRSDVVLFTSAPLTDDMEVTGPVEAVLWVSSTAQSADWTARLCAVDEDGRSIGLVDGIVRQPMSGETPTEVTVRLGHISHFFRKGWRLRLQVASSNFPRFDRNPQSGTSPLLATRDDFVTARHTIHCGGPTPSRLLITVIDRSN